MIFVGARAVQHESSFFCAASGPWLDTQHELGVEEFLSAVIDQHGVDDVSEGITHAGGHEDVLIPVSVQVADADAPRPVRLRANLIRNLGENAVALVQVKGVAKDIVRRSL